MTAQCDARGVFRLAAAVGRRCVEVVHTVLNGSIYEPVHHLLVDFLIAFAGAAAIYRGKAHHSESENRHMVAGRRVVTIGHLVGGYFALGGRALFLPCTRGNAGSGSSRHPKHLQEVSA